MDQMLEVFINEARDNLQSAGECFLELEKKPDDSELMDDLFRSIHTIKGSSGLFDIPAFTSTVHAAEDVLDMVRCGDMSLNSDTIDLLLDSMDQVSTWLDELEQSGELGDNAHDHSKIYTKKLRGLINTQENKRELEVTSEANKTPDDAEVDVVISWPIFFEACIRKTLGDSSENTGLTAITYTPEDNCFFSGDDPLHTMRNLPGLKWFDTVARENWPEPVDLDPYHTNLLFYAISDADTETLNHYLRYITEQLQLHPFSFKLFSKKSDDMGSPTEADETSNLSPEQATAAFNVLNAQQNLLQLQQQKSASGSGIASASKVVINLLNMMQSPADDFKALSETALKTGDTELLIEYLELIKQRITDRPDTSSNETTQPRTESDSMQSQKFELNNSVKVTEAQLKSSSAENVVAKTSISEKALTTDSKQDTTKNVAPLEEKPVSNKPVVTSKTLKVDQARIDTIMDLVGELVVAKNSLPFLARQAEEKFAIKSLAKEIKAQYAVINRLAEELQGAIMQVRMVPVSHVFQRFPRLVRDLSRKLNKKIRLNLEGEETEADKNVVENLADPLIHLVRNSLDHGLESPEERADAGKAEEGQLTLRAVSHEDQVVIEVIDDGRGIDPEVIKRKAYEKGVIDENRLDTISDIEALQLIFAAGFSTKEQVSDLSGRGVGMDVVRTVINEAGGSVKVLSDKGKGSTMRLTLPLSMAVTRVMMIEVAKQNYGISMEHVVETVRVPMSSITKVKLREVVVLRNRLIPIFYLRTLMNLPKQEKDNDAEVAVLVMKILGEEVGLVIDEFLEGVDILLKPLEGVMADFPVYSGAALLGNGRVLLVLNIQEFIKCQSTT